LPGGAHELKHGTNAIGRRRKRGVSVERNMLRGRPRRRQRRPRRRPKSKQQILNSTKTMEERLGEIVAVAVAAAAVAVTSSTAVTVAALVVVTRGVTMVKDVGAGKNLIASVNI
jgi:hypothetical protein